LGADGIETDLFMSSDGVVFLHHDPAFSPTRCTAEDRNLLGKPVVSLSSKEIETVKCSLWQTQMPGGTYTPTVPPRLTQILQGLRTMQIRPEVFVMEIKAAQEWKIDFPSYFSAIANELCGILTSDPLGETAVVVSFSQDALDTVRQHCPSTPRGLVVGTTKSSNLEELKQKRLLYLIGNHEQLDPEAVSKVRERGMRIMAYTPNDNNSLGRMIELGLDGIITDRPDLARKLLMTRGQHGRPAPKPPPGAAAGARK
jgi:glycerophosphoryl diester phosphodiesterase